MINEHFVEEVFKIQKDFTAKILKEKFNLDIDALSDTEKIRWLKEFILSGAKEFMEMLDELPWKQHTDMNADGSNFLEEGIDTFKFLINCFIIAGYNSEQFIEKYKEKTFIVNFKYEQQKKIKLINRESKVALIDIDGIINHYPKEFLDFVFHETTERFESIFDIKKRQYQLYKKLKHKFRLSGFEATKSIVRESIIQTINYLKEQGYIIILITARPYKKYNRLFFDTVSWLSENRIEYDLIFFEREKTKFFLENFVFCSKRIFIDDDIENINRIATYVDVAFLFKNLLLHTEDDYKNINKKVIIVNDSNVFYEISNNSFL